jgi:hypothetical protein
VYVSTVLHVQYTFVSAVYCKAVVLPLWMGYCYWVRSLAESWARLELGQYLPTVVSVAVYGQGLCIRCKHFPNRFLQNMNLILLSCVSCLYPRCRFVWGGYVSCIVHCYLILLHMEPFEAAEGLQHQVGTFELLCALCVLTTVEQCASIA